jgi:hypothetical protein
LPSPPPHCPPAWPRGLPARPVPTKYCRTIIPAALRDVRRHSTSLITPVSSCALTAPAPVPLSSRYPRQDPIEPNPEFVLQVSKATEGGKGVIFACEAGGTMKPSVNFADGKASRSLQVRARCSSAAAQGLAPRRCKAALQSMPAALVCVCGICVSPRLAPLDCSRYAPLLLPGAPLWSGVLQGDCRERHRRRSREAPGPRHLWLVPGGSQPIQGAQVNTCQAGKCRAHTHPSRTPIGYVPPARRTCRLLENTSPKSGASPPPLPTRCSWACRPATTRLALTTRSLSEWQHLFMLRGSVVQPGLASVSAVFLLLLRCP